MIRLRVAEKPTSHTARNASTAFNPPKANEFDNAAATRFSRATFGITSTSHSGSASLKFAVAGSNPR